MKPVQFAQVSYFVRHVNGKLLKLLFSICSYILKTIKLSESDSVKLLMLLKYNVSNWCALHEAERAYNNYISSH